MISTVFLQIGAGCILGLLPVPPEPTGRAFNRFVALLATAVLTLGVTTAPRMPQEPPGRLLWWMAILLSALSAGFSHSGRLRGGRFAMQGAAAWAVIAAALDAGRLASSSAGGVTAHRVLLYVVDAVSSAWLLGTVLVAMILGHYYLNIAGLAIGHLIRLTFIAVLASALRAAVFGWSLAAGGGALLAPILSGEIDVSQMLPAVVVVQRFLFGIAGAILISLMAWRTAKISSTQSATGILYIGVIVVLVGELASRYLLFYSGLPL